MNNKLKPVVRTVAGIISAKKMRDDPTVTGYIMAVRPIDNNGSVMFEPIKVPIATPFERLAAVSATANSGREVPIAVIVAPINAEGIERLDAISVADCTNIDADQIARLNPNITPRKIFFTFTSSISINSVPFRSNSSSRILSL